MINWTTSSTEIYIILIIGIITLIVVSYLEITRSPRRNIVFRLLLIILATISLIAAGLRPSYWTHTSSTEAIILSKRFDSNVYDSLMNVDNIKYVFSLDNQQPANTAFIPIANAASIKQKDSTISRLHILGEGIPSYEISDLPAVELSPHLAPIPQGINSLEYNSPLKLGEKIIIHAGLELQDTSADIKLRLAGQTVDSLTTIDSLFSLEHIPVNPGKYVYEVIVNAGGTLIQKDSLPVVVLPDSLKSVCMLIDIPSFESNYLKNWLGTNGHPLIYRVKLTRDRYRTDFINRSSLELRKMSKNVLSDIDLLVLDVPSLISLSQSEKSDIQEAVTTYGLCLLILMSESDLNKSLTASDKSFFLDVRWRKDDITTFEWRDQQGYVTAEKLPFHSITQPQLFSLVKTEKLSPAVWYRKGLGKIGISAISNTYLYLLQGQPDHYEALWSQILRALSPLPSSTTSWDTPSWAFIDEPVDIQINTSLSSPSLFYGDQQQALTHIPLHQDPLLLDQWQARLWPDITGWNYLYLEGDSTHIQPLYVFQSGAWNSLSIAQQQQKLAYHARSSNNDTSIPQNRKKKEFPLWVFYLVFLLSLGGIWLEQKLNRS